ncbi:MAG: hypothetical protein A2W91_05665 [Bacteroidetes bacterium GWF2_38_335]|nr:MAG: hypothetical protein A2W91_05665 [Bacteroidetes bacterium GWF2_38_335]HBS88913.1 hypothetical protein [Bacteroidales bacterium]
MKKLSSLLLALIVTSTLFVFDSCKKGEEDPFFSIQSRKQRVAGEWTINSDKVLTTYLDQEGVTTKTDFIISGANIDITTESINSDHDTIVTVGASEDGGEVLQSKVTFEKDGTFEEILEYRIIDEQVENVTDVWERTTTITTVTLITLKGTWNFMGSVEKLWKNKERISVVIESKKTTETETTVTLNEINGVEQPLITVNHKYDDFNDYANGENAFVYEIKMLKGKEMKLFRDINNKDYYAIDGGAGATVSEIGSQERILKQ